MCDVWWIAICTAILRTLLHLSFWCGDDIFWLSCRWHELWKHFPWALLLKAWVYTLIILYKIINVEEVSGEGLDVPEYSAIVYSDKLSFGLKFNSKSDFKCKIIHFVRSAIESPYSASETFCFKIVQGLWAVVFDDFAFLFSFPSWRWMEFLVPLGNVFQDMWYIRWICFTQK